MAQRYLNQTASASLHEFIRVHRSGLRDLDSTLYAERGSSRADLIEYLNDLIIEGKKEVKGGWVVNVPRLPPPRGLQSGPNMLAIALGLFPSRGAPTLFLPRIPPRGEQVRRNEQGASGVDGFVWRLGRA